MLSAQNGFCQISMGSRLSMNLFSELFQLGGN